MTYSRGPRLPTIDRGWGRARPEPAGRPAKVKETERCRGWCGPHSAILNGGALLLKTWGEQLSGDRVLCEAAGHRTLALRRCPLVRLSLLIHPCREGEAAGHRALALRRPLARISPLIHSCREALSIGAAVPFLFGLTTASASERVIGFVIAGACLAIPALVCTTRGQIFRVALYVYATTGAAPGAFPPATLEAVFRCGR